MASLAGERSWCQWAVLGKCFQGLLGIRLVEIFFLCASVSHWTGANMHLKDVLSQQITTGVFQCDGGEDGPLAYDPHSGAVPQEVVVGGGGTLRAHFGWLVGHHHTMWESVFVIQILGTQIPFHLNKMLRMCQTIAIVSSAHGGSTALQPPSWTQTPWDFLQMKTINARVGLLESDKG